MTYNFTELTELYKSIVSVVTRTDDYFDTDEFKNLEKANATACENIQQACKSLIKLLQGETSLEGNALPDIRGRIGFYNRLLKKQSKILLPLNISKEADSIIQSTFLLGLTSHLYLYDNPSRNGFKEVDAAAVVTDLAPRLMSSSNKMRKYNRKLNTIPILIFENYFEEKIEPLLKEKLNFGFLRYTIARNYFTNLFFGGARFGEMMDNETRMV
ncbi:MAG: hypothetical protein WC958_02185 [Dehalococcoidales bacterium]